MRLTSAKTIVSNSNFLGSKVCLLLRRGLTLNRNGILLRQTGFVFPKSAKKFKRISHLNSQSSN